MLKQVREIIEALLEWKVWNVAKGEVEDSTGGTNEKRGRKIDD